MAIMRILYVYMGDSCVCCGKTLNEVISRWGTAKGQFDFNHTDPSKKAENYRQVIGRQVLCDEQLDEAEKCVLLCKECHTALHGQDIVAEVDFQLNGGGVTITHSLQCQIVRDLTTGEDKLFTSERPLLHLVQVTSGSNVSICSCVDLAAAGQMDAFIQATRNGHEFKVTTLGGFCLFRARKLNDSEFAFSQSSLFHAAPFHAKGMMVGGEQVDMFIRRGSMMVRNHIGPGLKSIRAYCTRQLYTASIKDIVEDFKITSPDPLFPPDGTVEFGPQPVVSKVTFLRDGLRS